MNEESNDKSEVLLLANYSGKQYTGEGFTIGGVDFNWGEEACLTPRELTYYNESLSLCYVETCTPAKRYG